MSERPGPRVELLREAHGRRRLVLVDSGEARLSELTIDELVMHDGSGGRVRLGGIGNVATPPEHRRRGYARQLLEHAVAHMRERDLSGSLLYGIDDFYDRLGWRSCGDERWAHLPVAQVGSEQRPPGAWMVRAAREEDRGAIADCYHRLAPRTAGALERPRDGRAWAQLDPREVTVVEREGNLVGWAWRGAGSVPERDSLERALERAAVFAELQAEDDAALLVVCAAAARMARRLAPQAETLVTGAPVGHPLRRLCEARAWRIVEEHRPTGGAMLRLFREHPELDGGDLYQFLPDRF